MRALPVASIERRRLAPSISFVVDNTPFAGPAEALHFREPTCPLQQKQAVNQQTSLSIAYTDKMSMTSAMDPDSWCVPVVEALTSDDESKDGFTLEHLVSSVTNLNF
jgi:hypothetical protein